MYTVTVIVKPLSKHNEVVELAKDSYEVRTSAVPENGKANKEMIKIMAHFLRLPMSRLLLTKGEKGHEKTLLILDE